MEGLSFYKKNMFAFLFFPFIHHSQSHCPPPLGIHSNVFNIVFPIHLTCLFSYMSTLTKIHKTVLCGCVIYKWNHAMNLILFYFFLSTLFLRSIQIAMWKSSSLSWCIQILRFTCTFLGDGHLGYPRRCGSELPSVHLFVFLGELLQVYTQGSACWILRSSIAF